jgi:D-inositol-3-phosphate glycosyltransferase
LVDGHEPATWANHIIEVVSNEALGSQLSTGAIAHASHFGWEDTTEQLISVYSEAIKSSMLRANV